jgi:hypothetical protein
MNKEYIYNGVRFIKYVSENYYHGKVRGKNKWLHRYVWETERGEIPNTHHIHHIDGNKENNLIDNLALVEKAKHLSDHITPERRLKLKALADKIRPLSKIWHASVEGREWHRKQGIKTFSQRIAKENECACCHKKYLTKQLAKRARFCSNNCKMKARRRRLQGLSEDAIL